MEVEDAIRKAEGAVNVAGGICERCKIRVWDAFFKADLVAPAKVTTVQCHNCTGPVTINAYLQEGPPPPFSGQELIVTGPREPREGAGNGN